MLILARRPGERVAISENILVTAMAVNGHTVRLGIEAPESQEQVADDSSAGSLGKPG
jgi:carbon storage regulator CsrA